MKCIHGLLTKDCWCTMRSGNFGLINGQAVEFGRKVDDSKELDHTKIKCFIPHKWLPLRGRL